MSRKLGDLQQFAFDVRAIYGKNFQLNDLKYEIAKKFGTSDYIMNNVLKRMIEFRIIQEIYQGIYEMVEKKTKEVVEKEAKAEADKLLKGVKHGKIDKH